MRSGRCRDGAQLLAERGGFEPPVQVYPVRRFSKPLPSATQPSLLITKSWEIVYQIRCSPSTKTAEIFHDFGFTTARSAMYPFSTLPRLSPHPSSIAWFQDEVRTRSLSGIPVTSWMFLSPLPSHSVDPARFPPLTSLAVLKLHLESAHREGVAVPAVRAAEGVRDDLHVLEAAAREDELQHVGAEMYLVADHLGV